ncbi:hypothetical protein V6N13_012279 [Hibiscus sabdariffa]
MAARAKLSAGTMSRGQQSKTLSINVWHFDNLRNTISTDLSYLNSESLNITGLSFPADPSHSSFEISERQGRSPETVDAHLEMTGDMSVR